MNKVNIDREKNQVTLRFNNKIYTSDVISKTLFEFREVCSSKTENGNIALTPKDSSDLERLGYEFYNYALCLMKNTAKTKNTTIKKNDYQYNNYRSKKFGDKYLITSDHGSWMFLNEIEYTNYAKGHTNLELLPILTEKGFIITEDNLDKVINDYRTKCNFLFRGTSLHIVVPTLRCNQKCIYCHANAKPLDSQGYDMDEITAKKTVDLIFQSPSQAITIEFQGGEPLLRFDIIKYIIRYAKEKNLEHKRILDFRLVTNLTIMNEDTFKFIMNEKIGLCTSLDGPEPVHNKNRGEYKKTANWIDRIKKDYHLNAMMLVTNHSLSYPKEIVNEYLARGFDNIWIKPANELGYALVNKEEAICSSKEFLDLWKKSMDYLVEINKKSSMRENFSMILLKKILTKQDVYYTELQSPCGAAISQLAYNPDGSVYTCDEGRQYELFKLGTVDNKYSELINSPDTHSVITASLTDSLACDTCAYKPYCGVCPVCSYAETKNIITKIPNRRCEIIKGMFDYIFEKLLTDNEHRRMFLKWMDKC